MKKIYLSILLSACLFENNSFAEERRVALSLGPILWSDASFSLSYDQTGALPSEWQPADLWTLGAEITAIGNGFFIAPRALYWQNKNLSGFYGGPEVAIGLVGNSHYDNHHNSNNLLIGAGGQGGWAYRFLNEPKGLDLGGGIEILVTDFGLWASIKFSIGYLIP